MHNIYSESSGQEFQQNDCQQPYLSGSHNVSTGNGQNESRNAQQFYENPCKMDVPLRYTEHNQPMEQIFKSLFGSNNVSHWQYSEASLQKALDLRVEQERTKQEYYKIERLNRVVELLKLAAVTKVPGHLIPSLINSQTEAPSFLPTPSTTPVSSNTETPADYSPDLSPSPVRNGHQRSRTVSSLADLQAASSKALNTSTNDSASMNAMKNFKFGLGSSGMKPLLSSRGIYKNRTSLPPKHQLSPSRIGARAVSSLNRNSSTSPPSLMELKHGRRHQRTLSLPSSVTIPETKPMVFHNPGTENDRNTTLKEIVIPDFSSLKPNSGEDVDVLLNGAGSNRDYKLMQKSYIKSPLREVAVSNENETVLSCTSQSIASTVDHTTTKKFEPKTP